ncbi:MAG TPA: 50S ribosomal protein L11 methyltransferase [Pyrinomonadaceae bacterium]|nr:50S ribosomal protein L11 methyltransferase [Pyrinomonadaceae bacterium]
MNEAISWYSISVTVAPEASEAVESAFNALESLGTEINHLRKKNAESVTVVGYFNDLPDEETVGDELQYALRSYGFTNETILQIERQTVEDADWLAEWKKHWKPTETAGFVIAPPWFDVTDDSKIVIRIEPNMAFGTGTHETTRLCLTAIEEHYVPGDSFLDVGTGTGILAIAAAKKNSNFEISNLKGEPGDLPANLKSETSDPTFKSQISNLKLFGCDTDVDSVIIARENAVLNEVGGSIEFAVGSIDGDTPPFDFVCANLTLDVIGPLLHLLLAKASKTLVMSGILVEQEGEIVSALREAGISSFQIARDGDWISVVVNC